MSFAIYTTDSLITTYLFLEYRNKLIGSKANNYTIYKVQVLLGVKQAWNITVFLVLTTADRKIQSTAVVICNS